MENQLEKLLELAKLELAKEELEQRKVDRDLFGLLFSIFDSMSRIGQETTIDTLLMYLGLEKEE